MKIDGSSVDITTAAPSNWNVNLCSTQSSTPYHLRATCPVLNELDIDTGNGNDTIDVKNCNDNMQVNTNGGDDTVTTRSMHFQYVDLGAGNDHGTVTAPGTGQDSQVWGDDGDDVLTSLRAPSGSYSHAVLLYGGHGKDTFYAANGFYDDINCGKKWSKVQNRWVNDGDKDTVHRDPHDKVEWCP